MITGHIVVVDIGITTVKMMVFDTGGKTIVFESIVYPFLDRPEEYFEQSPSQVYSSIVNTTKKVIANAKEAADDFYPSDINGMPRRLNHFV
jgi:sugar (pentulose or hexulose) kinase